MHVRFKVSYFNNFLVVGNNLEEKFANAVTVWSTWQNVIKMIKIRYYNIEIYELFCIKFFIKTEYYLHIKYIHII